MASEAQELTGLLLDWRRGDAQALDRLIPMVFDDLRRMAATCLRRENPDHTLEPTALVSEVYLRLVHQTKVDWKNRQQFFAVAALLMRRILLDYAKVRHSAKRGGQAIAVPLKDATWIPEGDRNIDLFALDRALSKLSDLDPRAGRIVELRFLIGLTIEEIADVLGISTSTVKREWHSARLWLFRELARKYESESSGRRQ